MTRNHRFSLKFRLIAALFVVSAIGIASAAYFAYREVYNTDEAIAERTLQGQANEFLDAMTFDPATGAARIDLPLDWVAAYSGPSDAYAYTLYDANGNVAAMAPNLQRPLAKLGIAPDSDYGPLEFVGPHGLMVMAARAPNDWLLMVSRGQVESEALVESMLEESIEPMYLLIPSGIVALVTIWLVGSWSLRPLERASREASAVSPANPLARVSTAGLPDEVLPLVEAMNGALDRLSKAYEAERRLTADAAHELRTPLAVLYLRLQRAQLDGKVDWGAVRRDFEQLNRVVAQLLNLARMESAAAHSLPQPQSVNLQRIVREAAAMVLPLADDAGREVDIANIGDTPISILGYAADLRDMVRNLLDNALSHGKGRITIQLLRAPKESAEQIILRVSDEGDGISQELGDTVFDRFRKGLPSSSGSGLGLAIVRHVARVHGGFARVHPTERSCIEVVLVGVADRAGGQAA